MIELKNISKTYGKAESAVTALADVDLTIGDGELVAVIGPSGSGKSTLLNILGCLDRPTGGTYMLDGRDAGGLSGKELAALRNTTFGFVVQDFALINEYTVYQNIALPLQYGAARKSDIPAAVEEMLTELGISGKRDVYPTKLSGGQRQRVAIARALVNKPSIILADEPTGALDQNTGHEVMQMLRKINGSGKTVIIVTHNMDIANQCGRIVEIIDGRIKSDRRG